MLLVSLTGCSAPASPPVKTPEVQLQTLPVTCLGRLLPGERVLRISALPQAIVKQLHVARGERVRAGQLLATLRDYDLAAAALKESESELAVAQSAIAQAKSGDKPAAIAAQQAAVARQEVVLTNAERDFERRRTLLKSGDISAADFDRAQLAVDSARQLLRQERESQQTLAQVRDVDVALAESKRDLAQTKVARAKADLERYRIVSPAAATVLEIHAYPGETVGDAGLMSLGDTDHMFVQAEVYVTDVPRVRREAAARITGEGFSGTLTGRVVEILRETGDNSLYPPTASTAADKRVLRVRIALDDARAVQHLSNSQVSVRIEP